MKLIRQVISREVLFFTSLLGVFNGLFLTGYFLLGKPSNRYVNVYLGLMLLALVVRIGKSVFFYFDSGLNEIYIHIGLLGCMAIGPMCFCFVQSQLSGNKRFDIRSLIHLLPLLALIGYAVFVESYNENRPFWRRHVVGWIYDYWAIYMALSIGLILRYRFYLKKKFKDMAWTQGVVLGVTAIWLAYYTSSFTSYLTGALTFSFLVYLLAWILLMRRKESTRKNRSTPTVALSKLEVSAMKEKIRQALLNEDRYKEADLTMPALAASVGQTPHQFSQFINEHLDQNFSQLINSYRIAEARQMLEQSPHLTVEAIGFDCGFSSPSAFYTAFKKATGQTPAAYRKSKRTTRAQA